jgi:hypothetical protein
VIAVATLAALWLPQRPVRIALSLLNVLVILVLLAMFVGRRS